jgi:putative ABC transport system substrate-binding protein
MSLIERRRILGAASALVALAAATPALTVCARESTRRPYRVALVPDQPPHSPFPTILVDALRHWGRVEGRDYVIYRSGVFYGQSTKLALDRAFAAKPDLIIVNNLGFAVAAHKRTKTIPIVMWLSGFPVEGGVAESLAKPGMNVTGCTIYVGGDFFGKLLELLHDARPSIKRVGFLMSYVPPFHPRAETDLIIRGIESAAPPLGVDLRVFRIATAEQLHEALASVTAQGIEALVFTTDPALYAHRKEVLQFAVAKRLPTIGDTFAWWNGVEPQSLLTYEAPFDALMRQVGPFVERILWEGAKPGDLPIELPRKFKFTVSLKTAKAIGITIPRSILLRADQVIE